MRIQSTVTLSVAFIFLALCGSVFAGPVCTEIGQGNVPATLNSANSVYCLNENVAVAGTIAFSISADNVTLDCKGYTVTGSGSIGAYASGRYNTTVKNCNITGFGAAVLYESGSYSTVSNSTISDNYDGIWLNGGSNYAINSNRISFSPSKRYGLIFDASNSVFYNNTLIGTTSDQMYSDSGCSNNTFYWNNFTYTDSANVVDQCTGDKWNGSAYGVNEGNIWWNVMDGTVHVYGAASSGFGTGLYAGSSGSGYPYNNANSGYHVGGLTDYSPLTPSFGCGPLNTAGATYTLSSNISISGANCFTVNAANVTIDCAGHSITGSSSTGYSGIYTEQANTTVRNCTITGFDYGLYLNGATNGIFDNITSRDNNVYQIYLRSASGNTLSNFRATGSMDGIWMASSPNNALRSFNVISTGNYAFIIYGSNNNNISNFNSSCSSSAFMMGGSSGNDIRDYRITANTTGMYSGMDIRSSSNNNNFTGGAINAVTGTAVGVFDSSTGNLFANNTVSASSILVYLDPSSGGNTFYWNNFTNTANSYAIDDSGSNIWNGSAYGVNEGNIWADVMSGSVQISGAARSSYNPGLYVGRSGTGYPYSNSTSAKVVGGVADYSPLTPYPTPLCVGAHSSFACGESVTESCTLNSDMSISGGTCFTVGAAGVAMDCAGHSIMGDDTNRTYGISSGAFNTTIKNCIISGFSTAIYFSGATNGTIQNVTANTTLTQWGGDGSTGDGIAFEGATGNTIMGSRVHSQNSYAIRIYGGSSNNTVTNSISTANYNAVYVENSPGNTIANSTVSANDWSIDIRSSYNTVMNTTFLSPGGSGRLLMVDSGASGNTFCWNNFTATSGAYVEDENGANHYNSSLCNGEGNLWANVLNGSVDVRGTVHSVGFPRMYIGSNGTGLPYNDSTSGGMTTGVSDYAPITPTHDGPTYLGDCAVIASPGDYILNQSISGGYMCIDIEASDVTFGCQGNTITSTGSSYLMAIGYVSNVSILNCNFAGGSLYTSSSATSVLMENVNITGAPLAGFYFFDSTFNHVFVNTSSGAALHPYAIYNSVIENSTFISETGYALDIATPGRGDFNGITVINNTFVAGGAAVLNLNQGGNNIFALNNFTCTGACGLYVNDTASNNQYNATVDGVNQGNIYSNVISGAVDVRGEIASSIPGLYIGSTGSGYPYGGDTSGGMVTANVTDYAPLTTRRICDHYIGQADIPATLSSPNSVYCLNESASASGANAITIGASNITFDCRSHSISSGSSGSGTGIYSNQQGTTVQNCNIEDFYFGIFFEGASNGLIQDTNVTSMIGSPSSPAQAIRFYASSYNTISNVQASAVGNALDLQAQSNNNVVHGLTATSSIQTIAFIAALNNVLYNNTFALTGESGAEAYFDLEAHNNTLYWNYFTNTSGYYVDDTDTSGGNFFNVTRDEIDGSAYDNSLVSLYRAEGTANDELGNNNAAWAGTPAYATGHYGQAFSFDGTGSGNISVPDSPSLNPSAITVSAWIYITGSPEPYPSIACKSDHDGSKGYCLHVINGNQVKFWINNGGNYAQSGALPLNTWVHVVGTYSQGTQLINLYANGILADSNYYTSPIITSTDSLAIGNYPYSGTDNGLFEGSIDNVAIFNKSLSATQVEALYNSSYNRGNIWANVISGDVNITGNEPSAYGSGWYVGSAGSDYPYSSTTSGGKVTSNVVDSAPLVTHCRPNMQVAGGTDPVTLDCPGSTYTMQGDLDIYEQNAVTISADNVTLDCNGHSIIESDEYEWYTGVYTEYSGVIVRNCSINYFGTGIDVEDGPNLTVSNSNFTNINVGVYLENSGGNKVEGNSFTYINDGVDAYSPGNLIQYNNFTEIYDYGIYLDYSDNNVIQYNNFTRNDYGFYVYYSNNNQILYNTIINTTEYNFGNSISSCPFLYPWNGTGYNFASDFSSAGTLVSSKAPGGTPKAYSDYAKVEGSAFQPKNNTYPLQLTEEYDEISYIDELALLTADHSPGYDVYTGLLAANKSTIYTVDRAALRSPVSCTDALGHGCMQQISAKDGVYTLSSTNNTTNEIDLNLGNLTSASQVKLVLGYAKSETAPFGINRTVQVKDSHGAWKTAFASKDLIAPADSPSTYVLDMTGKFSGDYSVRLHIPQGMFDYVAVDTSPQQPVTLNRYSPQSADLHYRGFSARVPGVTTSYLYSRKVGMNVTEPSGNFTAYGDVVSLLNASDDMYAIMSTGDEISVAFPYNAPSDGVARDFFIYGRYYYKPAAQFAGNYSVTPLPFAAMSTYPYPANQSYPGDSAHQQYLSQWNTRQYALANTSGAAGSLPYSHNNTVMGNTIDGGPDSYGLYFYVEQDSSAINNTISNVAYGIYLSEVSSDETTMNISGNHIYNTSTAGIYMDYGYDGVLISNNTVDNSMVGMDINDDSEGNTISGNVIHAGNQPVWFHSPTYLAYGPDGYIYVSDVNNARIRRTNPATGATSLVAGGNATDNYAEGIGAAAGISNPGGLAFGSDGYLYFADSNNRRVRKINITTNETFFVAGSGEYSSVDGIGANASFESPTGLAFGPDGYLYAADNNNDNNGMLRAINVTTGEVTTIIASDFSYAYSIAFGPDGYLYAVDTNNGRVDQVNATTGDTSTIASSFYYPNCAIIGPDGYLYLAAYSDADRIDLATDDVSQIANGFTHTFGLAFDTDGYLYVSDVDNQVVDKINVTTGDVSLLAGKPGASGYVASPNQLAALRVTSSGYNTITDNTFVSESGPATYLANSPWLDFTSNTLEALNERGLWVGDAVSNSNFVGNNITASTWVDEGDPLGDNFNDSETGNIYYFANGTPSWQVYDISSSTGGHWADQGSDWPFSQALNISACTAQAEETSCTESQFWLGDVSGDWGGEIGVGSAPFDDDWETGTQPTSDTGSFYVVYGIQSSHINATVRVASSEESADFLVPDECYLDGIGINFTTDKINSQINVSCINGESEFVPLGQINGSTFNEQEMMWALKSPPWIGGGEDWHPYVGSSAPSCLNLSDESTWDGRISYVDECDLSGFIFGSSYAGPCYYAQSSFGMCPGQYDSYPMVINSTDTTIDCAGSTLTGNGSTLGIVTNQSGTSVKNCILQNFTIGVSIGAPEAYTSGDSVSNTTINLTGVPDCSIFGSLCAGMVMANLNDSNFTGITIDARWSGPEQSDLYVPLVAEEVENLTFENIWSNSSFNLGLIFMDAPGTVLSNVTSVTSYDGPGFIPYYGPIALLGAPNSVVRNVTGTSGYMGFFDLASPNTTFADSSFSGASTDFLIDSSVCSGSFTNVNGSNGLPILVYSSEGQVISGVNASMIALCGANYSSISDSVVNSSGIQIYDTSFANITNVSSTSPHSYTLYMQESTGISVANSTLRAGTTDCTYYSDCYPAFYSQDGSDNSFLGNEIYANYWVGGSDGGVTFNGSTSGNKYYLYDGTPAAAFCDIRSSTLTWADGGADLPFSSELSCLLDSDSNSRWQGDGEDYHPYVGACSPQMDITSLPANLTCANSVYTLLGNFTVEPTDTNVITVVANNVVIDCAGNSINGSGSQYGIYSARSGTHVKNCDLRDFNHASIYFTGSSNDSVENTYADDGKSGIVFESVSDSYIRNSTGLGVGDYGIYLYSCTGVNVTNSTGTVASGSYGIYLESSSGVRIINSAGSVTENGNYGIYLRYSEDTVLDGCTAYSIENDAMDIYNSPRTVMTGCNLTTDGESTVALNMYDNGEDLLTDNGTFTRNSFSAKGSDSEALLLQGMKTGNNTFLDNTFTSDRWVVSYSDDENFFNNSMKGNRYYFANGTGAWEVYNISSSTNGTWAEQGSDLPFSAALPSPGTYQLEQNGSISGTPSGWVNSDYVNDQDWSTGSMPETESAQLTKWYFTPSSMPRNISVKVGTDLGAVVIPVPGAGYDGIYTRIDILSHLEPAQVAVYYYNYSASEFQLLYEINGTSQLNESSIIWTLDTQSPWSGNDVDWHPHLVPRPNVYGNGSSIHTSGSGSLSNVTAAISGRTDVNGTEQDDVQTVNISNSSLPLFVFDYNFTGSSLNFSAVSIEQGTTGGKAYASISGINSSNLVGGKTLYMYNANTSIANVCVKDEEGAVYSVISATCTAANEHSVACDGISHSGYTCTYNGTTAVITGLQHSAAVQLSSTPSPTPTPSPSGGSNNNGGGSIGIGLIMPPIKQTTIYNVSMGSGKTCPISITRSMNSTLQLSTLTTMLENIGGSGCSMSDFVFTDTVPSDFPALNTVAFNPQYATKVGWTVGFSFPTFAPGESKILTYSANQWVRPSLAKNFTAYAMSAKVQQAVQPTTPAAPTAPEQPTAWIPTKLPTEQPATSAAAVLKSLPPETPSMLGFAAMLAAVAVVAGAVLFFAVKSRKKKEEGEG